MKFNNALRGIATAVTLLATTPSVRAEQLTDTQRACVQRVLKNSAADTDAVWQCLATAEGGGDSNRHKKYLSPNSPEAKSLFATLEARFDEKPAHYRRAKGVNFADVKKALEARPDLLWSLHWMEETGGKPDVIAIKGNTLVFADVSQWSPSGSGRCNLSYDEAKTMADEMGVKMMDEATYRKLQATGWLDTQTWSWILTDASTRKASGKAIAADREGDDVGVYPREAESRDIYRGWRAVLRVPFPKKS